MNWMSIVGLCLIVIGTVFSFFGTYFSDKASQNELTSKIQEKNQVIDNINESNTKLIDQNSTLLSSNDKVSNTNQNLITQNKDMLDKISRYQSDIEERNREIERLKKDVSNVKEYSFYATFDLYGLPIKSGFGIKFSSDLSDRMSKIFTEIGGKIYVRNDKALLPEIEEVIRRHPNFPFGYWAKVDLLRQLGDSHWRESAIKAISILEITTSITGHHSAHDEALAVLRQWLK